MVCLCKQPTAPTWCHVDVYNEQTRSILLLHGVTIHHVYNEQTRSILLLHGVTIHHVDVYNDLLVFHIKTFSNTIFCINQILFYNQHPSSL